MYTENHLSLGRRRHYFHVSVQSCFSCVKLCISYVKLFATPGTIAHQAPLSLGFCRQKYWSGLPCPWPGDLPHPGIKPRSLMSPVLAVGFFDSNATWEAHYFYIYRLR